MPKSHVIATFLMDKLKSDVDLYEEFEKIAKKVHLNANYIEILYAFTLGFEAAEGLYRKDGDPNDRHTELPR